MIKKIKIINHSEYVLRDTTIGKVYDVTVHERGSLDINGDISIHDTLCLIDDDGHSVAFWVKDTCYEVVEMTNNNRVNWDEIPEDVEAVVTYNMTEDTFFKKIEDKLYSQCWRHSIYKKSGWDEYSEILDYFGDRFHLRPSPITQPTPVTPESTQVESSEVEATTPPEFDWSSVEEDVEAVITYKGKCKQLLKTVEGVLKYQRVGELEYTTSCWYSTLDEREKCISHYRDGTATLIRRPPAKVDKPPVVSITEAFEKVAEYKQSTSIKGILQEAQQSILKHHGVTGKVKFTVTCSE